jgi:hypothetical protein
MVTAEDGVFGVLATLDDVVRGLGALTQAAGR